MWLSVRMTNPYRSFEYRDRAVWSRCGCGSRSLWKTLKSTRSVSCVIVGSLFSDTFPVTRLYSVDDRVISEWWWIGKVLVESGHGLILRYYTSISLKGLRKTSTSVKIAGADFNPEPPRYKAGVLTTWLMCNAVWFYLRIRIEDVVCRIEIFKNLCTI
jgi:hypothetical protein